jgi:putative transposase
MSPIKRTTHAVYDLKYHMVWAPKYRKMVLKGELAKRLKVAFVFVFAYSVFSGSSCTNFKEHIGTDGV